MDIFLSPERGCIKEYVPWFYPFGPQKETLMNALASYKRCNENTKVLFLGCCDLRNVLDMIHSSNSAGLLSIHLNHSYTYYFARNLLIVKVISATDFDVNNIQDISYLWDLWYNFEWPKSTLERFIKDVKDLVVKGLPESCCELKNCQREDLKETFNDWLEILKTNLTQPVQIKSFVKDRWKFILNGGIEEEMTKTSKAHRQLMKKQIAVSSQDSEMATNDFPESLKKKLSEETKNYFETGTCISLKKKSAAINPTLLEPKTWKWRVYVHACPFDSYLPLPLNELETSSVTGIATQYCQKKLKNLVASYRQKMMKIDFRFHLEDDLKFCLVGTSDKFDVIDTSILADELGLANVIISTSQTLEKHPDALLITRTVEWQMLALTLAAYVEESLSAPLSMIATMYGLQLRNQVELGSSTLVPVKAKTTWPLVLSWSPVPQFVNVSLWNSHALDRCLKKLEKMCYFMEEEHHEKHREYCGLIFYTPLTYHLVISRLAEQVMKMDRDCQLLFYESPIDPRFVLTRRALIGERHTVIQLTSPLTTFLDSHNIWSLKPELRIVLVPYEDYLVIQLKNQKKKAIRINWAVEATDTHYIDNFELCYDRYPDGWFRSLKVSFLLPQDHGLKTHCVMLVDVLTGVVVSFFDSVENMPQKTFQVPQSTLNETSSPPDVIPQGPHMQLVKCRESETDYTIRIETNSSERPKGLKMIIYQIFPCEAGHRVAFYLNKPEGMSPLTLTFPHPVLLEDYLATVRRSDLSLRVVLKKAINEPWPCQFAETEKWIANNLVPWEESKCNEGMFPLELHITGQYKDHMPCREFLDVEEENTPSALYQVRNLISSFLVTHRQYFCVKLMNDETLWHLRLHPPIRTSPSGSPIIFLSAVDHRLSQKLVAKGRLQAENVRKDVERIFGQESETHELNLETKEADVLLRYVLRLNSAKTDFTSWEVKDFPLDNMYAPFLATFLTPLYLDNPFHEGCAERVKKLEKFATDLLHMPAFDPTTCNKCGKKSTVHLKCCSKCKFVFYCSVECQRADWKKHKVICAELIAKRS